MNTHSIVLSGYSAHSPEGSSLYLGTAGSHGNEQLQVTLGEDWEGLTIQVVFHPCKVSLQLPADGVLDVPWEATEKTLIALPGRIVFQGFDQDRLVNSTDLAYTVYGHSSTVGRDEEPYTPGMVEGVLNQMAADKADILAAAQQAGQAKDAAAASAQEAAACIQKAADAAADAAAEATAAGVQAAADKAQAAANSAQSAAASAAKAEAIADELGQVSMGGTVMSVNGKTGRVQLEAADLPFDNAGTPFVSTTVQTAIEELLTIGGGGGTAISTITITAPADAVVTLSQGAKSYTQTVGEDGAALTFRVFETGLWDVVAVLDGAQDTGSVNVTDAGGSYSLVLDFAPYKAYIKVTGPDGAAVNVTKGGKSVLGTISGGSVTLTVSEGGKWSVAATYNDGIAQSTSVDVLEEQATYTAEAKFCTLTVTAPAGSTVEIKNGVSTLTGTADSGSIKFWLPNTGTWTTKATLGEQTANGSIDCAAYQDYSSELSYFSATIKVTAEQGATVKAVMGDYSVSGKAGTDGTSTLTVLKPGNYTVSASYSGASSNSKSVDVSESGQQYTVSVEFITLTVTAPEGSTITVKNNVTELTDTGGTVKFYLPNTGTWSVTAELDGQTASDSVECYAYQAYSTSLSYFSATIKVTAVQGATVKAVLDGYTVSGEASAGGVVTLTVLQPGSYTVNATYKNALSNSKAVQVSQSGQEYPVSVEFITLTVTAPAGSTITAKNGATTLTDTGGTVKFYLPNTGTWTVSASLGGDSASDSVQCNAYQNYSVELSYAPPENMNDATWAQIHELSASGKLGDYYDVGDGKDVTLNGTVGILNLSNLVMTAFILGINHNPTLEGNNKAHFALGKISGKQVALCDDRYNDYISDTCFHMNSGNDNSGWNQSYMRKTILGNSGNPSSPPSNSLLAALPADLRAVMQSVNKYTDNTGHGSISSGAVTATVDWLWLLAEFELYGSRTHANQNERYSQQQYDYFKAGNPKTFGKHNATGTVVWAWSRSPHSDSQFYFVFFSTDRTASVDFSDKSGGLFAGFAV